jgi:gas vesicle protein
MNKTTNFILGTLLGGAIGYAVAYLLGPAHETRMDATYQSRLDKALAEGKQAADQREAELRADFIRRKGRGNA